ncbi:MAG: hypothetical protein QF450_09030, partial [Rhodospirillales bacterium]|nr:hypothetical protein [Rhodospirillales bacterium]
HGLYAEEVYAAFAFSAGEDSSIEIKGGKFTQNFGVAWDVAPGVYGTDFAEDYELAERIGIGGALTFDSEAIGETTLSASTFFKDTSVFSESVIRNRGRTRFADGGPSNTEKPNSFAVALDGAPSGVPGLSYHISVARQAQGQGDTAAENGVAAAAQYTATAGAVEISPILELVYFDGAGGTAGVHQHYVTPGASVGWNGWNVTLSHTSRLTHEASGADLHDAMVQVSAGYEFESGSTADVGYRWSNE